MNTSRILMLTALALVLCASSAAADSTWTKEKGWSLGFRILSNHIGAADPDPSNPDDAVYVEETGSGAEISVGYAFTPEFALRLSAAGGRHDTNRPDVELNHFTMLLEAHYRFLAGERAQPYLMVGLGGTTLEFTSDTLDSQTSGGSAAIGLGGLYHFTRHFSLDFGARLEFINWNTVEVTAVLPNGGSVRLENPVDEDGSAAKILLGVLWNF